MAFEEMEDKLSQALVLGLPYFETMFEVERGTSNVGIRG